MTDREDQSIPAYQTIESSRTGKMAQSIRPDDLRGLLWFRADFPHAKTVLLYLGNRRWHDRGVEVLPFTDCVTQLDRWL